MYMYCNTVTGDVVKLLLQLYNVPASSGIVLSTKVMVEITTMEMEVKAQI
jgi:hypothetical protein